MVNVPPPQLPLLTMTLRPFDFAPHSLWSGTPQGMLRFPLPAIGDFAGHGSGCCRQERGSGSCLRRLVVVGSTTSGPCINLYGWVDGQQRGAVGDLR